MPSEHTKPVPCSENAQYWSWSNVLHKIWKAARWCAMWIFLVNAKQSRSIRINPVDSLRMERYLFSAVTFESDYAAINSLILFLQSGKHLPLAHQILSLMVWAPLECDTYRYKRPLEREIDMKMQIPNYHPVQSRFTAASFPLMSVKQ